MSLFPDPTTAYLDPFRELEDARRQLLHPRPDHRRGLLPRPAQHRPQGDGLPRLHRHRRHRLLRPRGRVLHLRQRPLRAPAPTRATTTSTPSTGCVEHRRRTIARQPRLQDPLQGRLLPGRALRPLRRPARRHGQRTSRTSGLIVERAHHEVGTAGQAEINYRFDTLLKAADDVMKFKYIIKNTAWAQRQDGHLHAEADLRRQRLGHARATSRSGTTASRCSTTRPATADCPTRRATTSAASSSTPRRCWRSPTRR